MAITVMVVTLLAVLLTTCESGMLGEIRQVSQTTQAAGQTRYYTVTYDGNGATSGEGPVDPAKYVQGQTATVLGNVGGLERDSFNFGGWNTAADGHGTSYGAGAGFQIGTADVTLYATWTEKQTYLVSYNRNEATSGTAPPSQIKTHDESLTLQTNTGSLARVGYTFKGWNSAADGSGADYDEGETYDENAPVTLYAKWSGIAYNIALNRAGGSGGSTSVTATYGSDMPETGMTAPSRTGYNFGGYFTGSNGTGTQYYTASMTSARPWVETTASTLYAKWTGRNYTVNLDRQGGTGGATSVIVTFGSPMPAEADPPTKLGGAFFGGYYTNVKGFGDKYYDAGMSSARNWDRTTDVTLYAEWIYPIGSTGPAGGIVFYDKEEYEHVADWRYTEAWTADEPGTYQWKTSNTITPGTFTTIGAGYANTYSAMAGDVHPAAQAVRNATHANHNDWFLPSEHELDAMYESLQLQGLGGFAGAWYWSSSGDQGGTQFANLLDFYNGSKGSYFKDSACRVRGARRF